MNRHVPPYADDRRAARRRPSVVPSVLWQRGQGRSEASLPWAHGWGASSSRQHPPTHSCSPRALYGHPGSSPLTAACLQDGCSHHRAKRAGQTMRSANLPGRGCQFHSRCTTKPPVVSPRPSGWLIPVEAPFPNPEARAAGAARFGYAAEASPPPAVQLRRRTPLARAGHVTRELRIYCSP